MPTIAPHHSSSMIQKPQPEINNSHYDRSICESALSDVYFYFYADYCLLSFDSSQHFTISNDNNGPLLHFFIFMLISSFLTLQRQGLQCQWKIYHNIFYNCIKDFPPSAISFIQTNQSIVRYWHR